MAQQVHIVPHCHWDREWYFSCEESKYLLLNNMDEIFEMLETRDDYPCYILDGQTAILEDYFQYKPENKARFKSLVQQGKLRIGPWYTQTDAMVVGGESITRNLLYGHKDCKEFGQIMKIGYLPDSFGQSSQMPMILNGFGIHRSMFWRGTSERMGTNKTEFYHESADGSKVLCQLLPLGYAIGKYLPQEKEALALRCSKYMPVLDRGATSDHILVPNGHDQMPIQKNIFEVMMTLKEIYPEKHFFLSDYESVFEELEKKKDYATLKGEFLDGKYMRVHRSIYSSRADIKSLNTRIEYKLTNILEPLATIAHSLGFDYFDGAIERIWKDIMKNHAHDSIGCCCSDKVHKEIVSRFTLAEEKIDQMITFYKRKIVDAMSLDLSLDKLSAFNLLPYEKKGVIKGQFITRMKGFEIVDENKNPISFNVIHKEIVDAGLIDRQIVHYGNYDPFVKYEIEFIDTLPAMGYKTYFILESEKEYDVEYIEGNALDNEYYHIDIHENGTLKILDKVRNTTYDNVLLMEDGSDDGDSYDYSPLEKDWILTSENCKADVSIQKNVYSDIAKISLDMHISKDLEERINHQMTGMVHFDIQITLQKQSDSIDIRTTIHNQAKDHRVRMILPMNISSKTTLADNPFGTIERSIVDSAMEVWEKEKWSERPDSIYPMLSFVKMKEDNLSFITNSIREYEAIDENTLSITLFRSIGYLGKENLVRRPGRPSGIKMEIPDSQMIGTYTFDFALTCQSNETIAKTSKEYLTPVITYNKMPYNAMKLNIPKVKTPYQYSLLNIQNDGFILSALKLSENKEGYIVRGYNPTSHPIEVDIVSPYHKHNTNLNEEIIQSNVQMVSIVPNQVKTVFLSK
ncbi:MAG: alpha-mannosidase [Holdemanella sp.]|nr:alpha-mannosidase [Holdemanella sp.]